MIRFIDPYEIMLVAVQEICPDIDVDVQFDDSLDMDKNEYGFTCLPEDGSRPYININPNLTVQNSIDILAHEFSHVIAEFKHEHDEKFWEVYEDIYEKYVDVLSRRFKEVNKKCFDSKE